MKKSALPIAILGFLAIGCRQDPAERLVGTWFLDPAQLEMPKIPIPSIADQARSLLASTTLKVRRDGTCTLSTVSAIDGKWTYADGLLTVTPDDPKILERLRLGDELKLTVDPSFRTITLEPDTPFGKAKLVLAKSE